MLRARQKGEGVGLEEGGGGRGGRLQKFKRHPAAALTPFNSAKRWIGIENKLSFFDKKIIVSLTVRRKKLYMGLVNAFLERFTVSLKSLVETQTLS